MSVVNLRECTKNIEAMSPSEWLFVAIPNGWQKCEVANSVGYTYLHTLYAEGGEALAAERFGAIFLSLLSRKFSQMPADAIPIFMDTASKPFDVLLFAVGRRYMEDRGYSILRSRNHTTFLDNFFSKMYPADGSDMADVLAAAGDGAKRAETSLPADEIKREHDDDGDEPGAKRCAGTATPPLGGDDDDALLTDAEMAAAADAL
jgi:hypothetical protein